jgi:PAS domain S-box-containing protein/putative nucleotidyltransferase with HDIG domain
MPGLLRVLFLEDNPSDVDLLLHALKRAGYVPEWERVDTEADYLARLSPDLDVILADYNLPQFDALRALSRLRERQLDIPFIVITGSIEEIAVECMKQGASDYLLKDRLGRLGQAVERAVSQRKLQQSRKQAEISIYESEQKFRSFIEQSSDGFVLVDEQGNVIEWNQALEWITGLRREEVVGRPFWEVQYQSIPLEKQTPAQLEYLQDLIQDALRTGQFLPDFHQPLETEIYRPDGGRRIVQQTIFPIRTDQGYRFGSVSRDVTEHRLAEAEIEHQRTLYEDLVESIDGIVWEAVAIPLRFTFVSRKIHDILGYSPEYWIRDIKNFENSIHPDDRAAVLAYYPERTREKSNHDFEYRVFTASGLTVWLRDIVTVITEYDQPVALRGLMVDVTARHHTELVRLATYRISEAANSAQNLKEFYGLIHTIIGELMHARNFYIALYDAAAKAFNHVYHVDEFEAPWLPNQPGKGLTAYVFRTGKPLLATPDVFNELVESGEVELLGKPAVDWLGAPLKTSRETIGVMAVQTYSLTERLSEEDQEVLMFVSTQVAMAIERKQAEDQIRRNAERLVLLDALSQTLVEIGLDYEAVLAHVTRRIAEIYNGACVIQFLSDDNFTLKIASLHHVRPEALAALRESSRAAAIQEATSGLSGQVLQTGQPILLSSNALEQARPTLDPAFSSYYDALGMESLLYVPLRGQARVIGVLAVFRDRGEQPFTPDDQSFLQEMADRTGLAIINTRLYADSLRRLEYVQALREIDMAITGSVDLHVTLRVILEKAMAQLHMDAVDVLTFNPYAQTLNFIAGRGFRTRALQGVSIRLGQYYAGRAALERRPMYIPNLLENREWLDRGHLLASEGFISCYVMPLLSKGQIKGVMEVFSHTEMVLGQEWQDFLESIAGQAAIAIDNATLFDDLQRSNVELKLAYDATIEGWSRALDLRDRETEGHTKRVTEMTERLAQAMNVSDGDLVHIRRGALLHDIGKMGVPDFILLKTGKLSEEEWVIMRKHPQYAYDMLAPISYLRPALDIPYCHHEKWDGSGYPRGLKGEQIPLAARIFAVVDVWDATTTGRIYHPPWPKNEALKYVYSLAGKQFDPMVVDAFIEAFHDEIASSNP